MKNKFDVTTLLGKGLKGAVLGFILGLASAIAQDPPASLDDLWAKLGGYITVALGIAVGGGALEGGRNAVKHKEKFKNGVTTPGQFPFIWILLPLCAGAMAGLMLNSCAMLRNTVQVVADIDLANASGQMAVQAYQHNEPVTPYAAADTMEREDVRRLAFVEGAGAFGHGLIAARTADPEGSYDEWARSALDVASFWVQGRYPNMVGDWLDLLFEFRQMATTVTAWLPEDLRGQVQTYLGWLDMKSGAGTLPDLPTAKIRTIAEKSGP